MLPLILLLGEVLASKFTYDCDYYFPGIGIKAYGLVGGGPELDYWGQIGAFRLSVSRQISRQSEVLGACL